LTCNFGIQHYQDTINAYLDAGYNIGPVSDYFQHKIYNKQILLRHDVDLSLDYAYDLSILEYDMGIRATYYIQLRSDLYSAISASSQEVIRGIRRAGHEIGLHVDSRCFLGFIEFEILARIAECNITTWCHHLINQTPHILMPRDAATVPYKYISDSAMNWREGCFCNHINKYDKLHILIHPEWHIVRPNGEANRWEILESLEEAAKTNVAVSFRDFRDLMKAYFEQIIFN
jgi:hypothetical protein